MSPSSNPSVAAVDAVVGPGWRESGRPVNGSRPRTMVLVDLENLCGSGDPSAIECHWAQNLVATVADDREAQVVVAVSHHAAPVAMFSWQGGRVVLRSGQDGADLALLEVIRDEGVAERFGRVVLGSGDGIFATAVAELVEHGLVVDVVAPEHSIASSLARVATGVTTTEQAAFDLIYGTAC